jgi:hypothetical protein
VERTDGRLEKSARNEALWREVNERIEELDAHMRVLPHDELLEFHCECGRAECESRISMTPDEYRRVREQSDRFAVVPGHEQLEIERPVERNERYLIVDKLAIVEPYVGGDGIPNSGS